MKKLICLLVGFVIISPSLCVISAEPKPTEAPVINYTLSETEDTWNPITVTLDITDDEEIVDVRYVRATQGRMAASPDSETAFNIASVPYDIDCKDFFFREYYNTDEEYEKIFGTLRAGFIAESYYFSAFESYYNEKDELVYKDNSIPVENGRFSVCYNDNYIIYAEDKTGNKTFRIFEVRNIKQASADVDLNIYSDFSGEYIAEAKLNVIENPNAPVKNIYLYKHSTRLNSAGGAISDFIRQYSNLIESVQRGGYIIPSVNGVYYLKGFGKYRIIFEDAWGGFSMDSFVFSPCGTDIPEFECKFYSHENDNIRVEIEQSKDNIAKLEYVQVGLSYSQASAEHLFESVAREIDRTVIKNNSFIAEPDKIYAVRALSTDGSAFYQKINTNKIEIYNYPYEIKDISISTQGGEPVNIDLANKNFTIKAEVNKIKSSDTKDNIIVAVYDINGVQLYTDCTEVNFEPNNDNASFEFNVPALNRKLGSIKAFIWDDFNLMNPLAEAKIINFDRR